MVKKQKERTTDKVLQYSSTKSLTKSLRYFSNETYVSKRQLVCIIILKIGKTQNSS